MYFAVAELSNCCHFLLSPCHWKALRSNCHKQKCPSFDANRGTETRIGDISKLFLSSCKDSSDTDEDTARSLKGQQTEPSTRDLQKQVFLL